MQRWRRSVRRFSVRPERVFFDLKCRGSGWGHPENWRPAVSLEAGTINGYDLLLELNFERFMGPWLEISFWTPLGNGRDCPVGSISRPCHQR